MGHLTDHSKRWGAAKLSRICVAQAGYVPAQGERVEQKPQRSKKSIKRGRAASARLRQRWGKA